ncbi:MAG TPA: hypothetical protein VM716_03240 [Gemmatimonadales bacterium]|nr:hypothetical protein [Gemmatimonadales bacterium]
MRLAIPCPVLVPLVLHASVGLAQQERLDSLWSPGASHTTASLRGLAVTPGIVWASGQRGTFLRSTDAGATWITDSVPGAAAFDFRGVAALDARTALLMVAAQDTARIYRTTDAGRTWAVVYDDRRPGAFLDAIAVWDRRRAIALGDPMDGVFVVLLSDDDGAHWTRAPPTALPRALPGEGAFAASNSCLITGPGGTAWFASGGGAVARVFHTTDFGRSWSVVDTPLPAGDGASGIFSLAFRDSLHGVAVGGDYQASDSVRANVALTSDGGRHWTLADPARATRFLSGVAYTGSSPDAPVVAVGTRGTWVSLDGGLIWSWTGSSPYNAVVATGGTAVAVGPHGAVATWSAFDYLRRSH